MNLPPLPELPLVFTTSESDIHKLMREYGALCRKQALEEAIDVCVQFGDDYMCQSTTLEIAKEIREQLK